MQHGGLTDLLTSGNKFDTVRNVFPFSGLLDLLCPPICLICGARIEDPTEKNEPICSACFGKIVTSNGQFCRRCGGRRFAPSNDAEECSRCRTTEFRFKRVIALGEYANDLRWLILRMKTDITGILATSAAKILAHCRRAVLESTRAEYIVPVQMHRLRRTDRGVNSPDFIAEELGQRLKIPVVRHLVQRVRQTDLQYTLSHRARAENVSGAFALRSPNFLEKLFNAIKSRGCSVAQFPDIVGKNILLVDDILTTGSTCNEITKVLLAAGVRSVTVAVLARAEGNFHRE